MFRENTPKRRPITTLVNSHGDHKEDLRIDFARRCGYCNAHDSWKLTFYEVDHFIPKKRNKMVFLTIKKDTDYSNLVYSCRSCNNAKRNKWPTENENIPNENGEGFIDPCDEEYNNQFDRLSNGRIMHTTKLGEWMYNAMQFYKPQQEIIWNLEEVEKLINEIESINSVLNSHPQLQTLLLNTYRNFKIYVDKFREL